MVYNSYMKIGIGIPLPDRVHPDFAIHSLTAIIKHTRDNLADTELLVRYESGVRTDRNRNIILQDFIAEDVDYVLWLDADEVYPADIIERLLEVNKFYDKPAIVGSLYFKRTDDHKPVGYIDSDDPARPFRPVMPQLIKRGKIYEVTGLGYGGMLVPMSIYDALGEEKWTKYGDNFHNPLAETGNLTHDLEFCRTVKKHGFKIFLHGSVRPGHIGEKLITEEDFYAKFPPKLLPGIKVRVLMPATNEQQARQTAELLKRRAGYDCEIEILLDKDRQGYVKTINKAFRGCDEPLVVYTAQDVFAGQNWLSHALLEQFKTQAGVVAFNDGKWEGKLPSFGLVERSWVAEKYDGNLFHPDYHSHYADTELGQLAKQDHSYAYAKEAVMLEIDYDKAMGRGKGVNVKDKKLYSKRIKKLVGDELATEFA